MSNPFKKLSARSIRILYSLSALIVLVACLMNFYLQMFTHVIGNDQCRWIAKGESRLLITDIVSGGVTDLAGIKDGDILIKINGENFKKDMDAQRTINTKAGSYVTYTIERDGRQFDVNVLILKLINLSYISQLLLGIGFLFVGYIVVMMRPLGKIQRMFARYSILSMLFFGLSALELDPGTHPLWYLGFLVQDLLSLQFLHYRFLSDSSFFSLSSEKGIIARCLLLYCML